MKRTKKNLIILVLFTALMSIIGVQLTLCTLKYKMFVGAVLVCVCTVAIFIPALCTYAEILIKLTRKEVNKK
jgi:hypothetical protein